MTDDEHWFLDQGYGVVVEQAEPDLFRTHLLNRHSLQRVAPNYGRGATAEESIARARRRYETEQLGT